MQFFRDRRERGRPAHPDILTPAEWRVLEHLRTGRKNPEIAVRLGVSVNTVRTHVSSMLAKLELPDRQALAEWDGEPSDASRHALSQTQATAPLAAWWAAGRVVTVGAITAGAAVLISVAVGVTSNGSQADPAVTPPTNTAPALIPDETPESSAVSRPPLGPPPSCDIELPDDFTTVSVESLRRQGLVEIGPFVNPRACELRVSNRAAFGILWLADGGDLLYDQAPIAPRDVDRRDIRPFQVAGFEFVSDQGVVYVDVTVAAGDHSVYFEEIVTEGDRALEVDRIESGGTFLILHAWDPNNREHHRVAVSTDGILFVDPIPIPDSDVIAWQTGERIPTENLALLQRSGAVGGWGRTACLPEDSACTVVFFPDERLLAPVTGRVTCPSDNLIEYDQYGTAQSPLLLPAGPTILDAGDFILHYRWLHGRAGGSSSYHCEPGDVLPGDPLSTHNHFRISASTPDGHPLSVVIAEDGTLYVGDARPRLGCPCQGGP